MAGSTARGTWLVKSEPHVYSWDEFSKDGGTCWDGVRNFAARNHLRSMRRGDRVLYYHSGEERRVVGVARVRRESYPDPTSQDERWLAVDLEPVRALRRPVSLARIKQDTGLRGIPLVRQPRLSVMPLEKVAFDRILELGA